jgi:hypothetical protein
MYLISKPSLLSGAKLGFWQKPTAAERRQGRRKPGGLIAGHGNR